MSSNNNTQVKAPRGRVGQGYGRNVDTGFAVSSPHYTDFAPNVKPEPDGQGHLIALIDRALLLERRARQRQLVGLATTPPERHRAIRREMLRLLLSKALVASEVA